MSPTAKKTKDTYEALLDERCKLRFKIDRASLTEHERRLATSRYLDVIEKMKRMVGVK